MTTVIPGDGDDASVHVSIVEGGEEGSGQVEVSPSAARAEIGDLSGLGVSGLVVGDGDVGATIGLAVLSLVDGNDKVRTRVGPSTSSQTSSVVCGSTGRITFDMLERSGGDSTDHSEKGEEVGGDHFRSW